MLSNAAILKKTAPIKGKKKADTRAHFHMGSCVPVHRMSIITIVSIEFILKASLEIIAHSLGRTIWLSKQEGEVWLDGWKHWSAKRLIHSHSCTTICHSKGVLIEYFLLKVSFKHGSEEKSSGKPSNQQTTDFLRIKTAQFSQKSKKIGCWEALICWGEIVHQLWR